MTVLIGASTIYNQEPLQSELQGEIYYLLTEGISKNEFSHNLLKNHQSNY
jgi:hypothetical protein